MAINPTVEYSDLSHANSGAMGANEGVLSFAGPSSYSAGGESLDIKTLAGLANEPVWARGYSTDGVHEVFWHHTNKKAIITVVATGAEASGDLSAKTYKVRYTAKV